MVVLKRMMLCLFLSLAGCSEIVPITLSEPQQIYVGVWHYYYQVETGTRFELSKILLNIDSDSNAIYKTCRLLVEKKQGSRTSSKSSTFLDSAMVTKIDNKEISLVQETEVFNVNFDLLITKKPFKENNTWYMVIDKMLLVKIESPDMTQLIQWDCPESTNIIFAGLKT